MRAVILQGQAHEGLRPPDERRLHVDRVNQSQDSADDTFECVMHSYFLNDPFNVLNVCF